MCVRSTMRSTMPTDSMSHSSQIQVEDDEVRARLVARGSLYKLFSIGLDFPKKELLSVVTKEEYRKLIIESPKVLRSRKMSKSANLFFDAVKETSLAELEADYNRLFVGKPSFSLYGGEYGSQIFSKTNQMADIGGFVRAFKLNHPVGERVDHISVELEFMYALVAKELYSVDHDWTDKAEICSSAEKKFFAEHMLPWISEFCEKFTKTTNLEFYRHLTSFLKEFINVEKSNLNVTDQPQTDPNLRKDFADLIPDSTDNECPL